MLQQLQGAATKWVGLVLFGLLMISFVFWGIADVFKTTAPREVVGSVGPLEITGQQLQNEVQRELAYNRNLTGRALTPKQALESGVVARVANGLVDRALLEQEAQRLGLRVPQSVVLNAIRNIPSFKRDSDGSFDPDKFKSALAGIGMSENAFLLDQRISLAREQLAQSATSAGTVPKILQQALAAARSETRTVETYRFKLDDQAKPAAPDDGKLSSYVDDHKADFMKPETRTLSLIRLTAADAGKDTKVSDDEIAKAYEARKGELAQPEKRTLVQVVTSDEAKAKAIAEAAQGKDLAIAAKAAGLTTATLNNSLKADLPDQLQQPAFDLPLHAVSQPVQSPLGWHVIQATGITPAQTATLENSRKRLTDDLQAQKSTEALTRLTQDADDQAASGASLDEIANQLGVTVQTVGPIDASGHTVDGKDPGPVLAQPEMLKAAFRLPQGKQSDLLAVPGEQYYIVHVDAVTPAAVPPLAAIRGRALAAWQREQQLQTARDQATKLEALFKADPKLTMVAATQQTKAEATTERALTRAEPLPKYLPPSFGPALFALKQGGTAHAEDKDAVTVVRVTGLSLPTTIEAAKPDATTTEELQGDMSTDLFSAYAMALRQRYPVKLDENKIAALFMTGADKTGGPEDMPDDQQ